MNDITLLIIILTILTLSIRKIIIEKRKGSKCIGCSGCDNSLDVRKKC